MRKSRRLIVPLAAFALVAGTGLGLGLTQVANAQPAISCPATGTNTTVSCFTSSVTITSPTAITLVVTLSAGDGASPADQDIVVTWSGDCVQGSNDQPISGQSTATPITTAAQQSFNVAFPTGMTTPGSCNLIAGATLEAVTGSTLSDTTTGTFQLDVDATTNASASPTTTTTSAVNVSLIRGYDSKCVDDKRNGSNNGTAVIIWSCNSADPAQGWTYTNGELQHNGKCENDAGNGGSGAHVILWTCNGASNEKWTHTGSDGEFVLKLSSHGQICLDDPGNSKNNGTQLIVYTCKNSGNQHWT